MKSSLASQIKPRIDLTNCQCIQCKYTGGGKCVTFSYDELRMYTLNNITKIGSKFKFKCYTLKTAAVLHEVDNLVANCPLQLLVPKLTIAELHTIAAHSWVIYSV
jgi:hypothetical protein